MGGNALKNIVGVRFKKLGKKEVFICVKCMIKEIKYYIRNLLLYFIQKQKRFFLSRNKEQISDFLNYNITLGNVIEININDAIEDCHKLYKQFTFESLIKNIRQSICIVCDKPLIQKLYNLPCGCWIGSQRCINDFYKLILKSIKFKGALVCFCGKIYEFKDIYNLVKNKTLRKE